MLNTGAIHQLDQGHRRFQPARDPVPKFRRRQRIQTVSDDRFLRVDLIDRDHQHARQSLSHALANHLDHRVQGVRLFEQLPRCVRVAGLFVRRGLCLVALEHMDELGVQRLIRGGLAGLQPQTGDHLLIITALDRFGDGGLDDSQQFLFRQAILC